MRKQIYIIFNKNTSQEIIDQWVAEHNACAYWTSPTRSHLALAEEEGWSFPHILEEYIEE